MAKISGRVHKEGTYRSGQWAGFDTVLNMLNSIAAPDDMTADAMRRHIYGLVMELRPK